MGEIGIVDSNDGLRVSVSFNENEYRVGYLAGRLFSLLEWLYYGKLWSKIRNMFSNEFLIRVMLHARISVRHTVNAKKILVSDRIRVKKRLEIEKTIDNILIIINRFPCIFVGAMSIIYCWILSSKAKAKNEWMVAWSINNRYDSVYFLC